MPQSSVLGPFLFLIDVNDLPNNVSTNIFMYEDDTPILSTDSDYHYLLLSVKADFADAEEWFSASQLF